MKTPFAEVLSNPDFRKLWLGQIISQVALNMLLFVLALHVYSRTHSNAAVSLMLLTFGIPSIIFGVIAGGIVDHFDKRKILLFCNTSRVLILLLFFLLSRNLFALYLLSVLISIVTQLFIPAEGPSIPLLVKKKNLLSANSLFTISFYISVVAGFILAGPFVRIFGNQAVYLVMAFFMALASYFVYKLPPLDEKKKNKQTVFSFSTIQESILDGISFIRTHVRIQQSLYLMTFAQALIATLSVLAPGFADKVLSIELTDASFLVMGPAGIGLVVGAYTIGGLGTRILKGKVITIGIIATGINLMLLSLMTAASKPGLTFYFFDSSITVSYLILAMILLASLGMFNSFISVPANTILQEDSNSAVRGRIYGVLTSLTGGISLIPVVFSGILADTMGVGKTLALLGIGILAIGIYQYRQRQNRLSKIFVYRL